MNGIHKFLELPTNYRAGSVHLDEWWRVATRLLCEQCQLLTRTGQPITEVSQE